MYEIRPEKVKAFIEDRDILLPRFQRKQTWKDDKNFKLCMSVFRGYPIGVTIISNADGKKYLLDGRQRRTALRLMGDDPENIYNWAYKYLSLKSSMQPYEVESRFREAISEYLENDEDEDVPSTTPSPDDVGTDDEPDDSETTTDDANTVIASGTEFLLQIIKAVHKKTKKDSGFTRPFDFHKYVEKLDYVTEDSTGVTLSSVDLKEFIESYLSFCDKDYDRKYNDEANMFDFLNKRKNIKDEAKLKKLIKLNWQAIIERIEILKGIDRVLSDAYIGVIEVKNMTSTDHQKIFNLINSQGEPLKAVEILSSKVKWSKMLQNPSVEAIDATKALYKAMNIENADGVTRWDLAATFLRRLGSNYVFEAFDSSKPNEFVKELTLSFKIVSGILGEGVTKDNIEKLPNNESIYWETEIDNLLRDVSTMMKVMSGCDFFKFFASWKTTLMKITSDHIALNFFIIAYKNWKVKGFSKTKEFQSDCVILFDKLIYEYVTGKWKSSADAKIRTNLNDLPSNFEYIKQSLWEKLLNEIFEKSQIDGADISFEIMKPILYLFYCLYQKRGPNIALNDSLDVDHIIPQYAFENSKIDRKDVVKNNILNLGILSKENNITKGKRMLNQLGDDEAWLKQQVQEYEFIEEKDYDKYSKPNAVNYQDLYDFRKPFFLEAFTVKRKELIGYSE